MMWVNPGTGIVFLMLNGILILYLYAVAERIRLHTFGKYASAQEIFAYCQRIAESYGVYTNACFQASVTELRWHQDKKRWRVSANKNDSILCRFICSSSGRLNRSKLPNIKGVNSFSGHAFHSSPGVINAPAAAQANQ